MSGLNPPADPVDVAIIEIARRRVGIFLRPQSDSDGDPESWAVTVHRLREDGRVEAIPERCALGTDARAALRNLAAIWERDR